jgi:hypothetical protein
MFCMFWISVSAAASPVSSASCCVVPGLLVLTPVAGWVVVTCDVFPINVARLAPVVVAVRFGLLVFGCCATVACSNVFFLDNEQE